MPRVNDTRIIKYLAPATQTPVWTRHHLEMIPMDLRRNQYVRNLRKIGL